MGMAANFASCPSNRLAVIAQLSKKGYIEFKSNIIFLLALPFPSTLLELLVECVYSVCTILLPLAGDVELDPGPTSEAQAVQFADMSTLLQDLSARSAQLEEGQSRLTQTVNEIKNKSNDIQKKVFNKSAGLNPSNQKQLISTMTLQRRGKCYKV